MALGWLYLSSELSAVSQSVWMLPVSAAASFQCFIVPQMWARPLPNNNLSHSRHPAVWLSLSLSISVQESFSGWNDNLTFFFQATVTNSECFTKNKHLILLLFSDGMKLDERLKLAKERREERAKYLGKITQGRRWDSTPCCLWCRCVHTKNTLHISHASNSWGLCNNPGRL